MLGHRLALQGIEPRKGIATARSRRTPMILPSELQGIEPRKGIATIGVGATPPTPMLRVARD